MKKTANALKGRPPAKRRRKAPPKRRPAIVAPEAAVADPKLEEQHMLTEDVVLGALGLTEL
jgi:hypothetical protein